MGRMKEVFHSFLAEKPGSFFTACGGSAIFAFINLGIDCNIHLLVSVEENSVEFNLLISAFSKLWS